MKNTKFLAGLALSLMVAGCSVGQKADDSIRDTSSEAGSLSATAAQPMAAADYAPVKVSSKMYVGSEAVRNVHGDPLPSKFETKNGITIVKSSPISIAQLAKEIASHTGIPVVLGQPVSIGSEGGSSSSAADNSLPRIANGPIPSDFPLGDALQQLSASNDSVSSLAANEVSSMTMEVDYSGSLSGLLDVAASYFNLAWKYESGKVVLDTVVSRTFDVPALAMVTNLTFDLTSASSTQADQAGSDSAAGQTAKSTLETDVFKEIETAITSMIPAGTGSFSISRSAGTVTVTGRPSIVDRVSSHLKSVNEKLDKQIALSVKVYSVVLNNDEEFDLDVQGMFTKAAKHGVSIGAASMGGVVPPVGGEIGPGLGWALLDTSSDWYGSKALVQALSTQGDVSVVTTASVTTLSGVPVPFQVGEQRDYVHQVDVIKDNDANTSTTSIQTKNLSTGFSLQVNPRVERNGDVLVQYGINISELVGKEDGFDQFVAPDGSSSVQLRRVSVRNFIQQARIPNKNTLVLAGFEQVRNESQKSGVGRPNFPLFGGGNRSSIRREILVIVITPTVLKSSM